MTRQEVRERQGERTLPGIALAIHGAVCGSGEWYTGIEQDVQLLRDAMATWQTPTSCFDQAVLNMLDDAVLEYDLHLRQAGKAEKVPDDAVSIDVHWLMAVGFIDSGAHGGHKGVFIKDIPQSPDDSVCWNANTGKAEVWIGSRYINVPAQSRGDMRRLCAALGVPATA